MITDKEILLLELLGNGEHPGAHLARRSRGRIRYFQIYPMLGKLMLNELVVARTEPVKEPGISVPRLLYRRTAKGTRLVRKVNHSPHAPSTQEALDQAMTKDGIPSPPLTAAWVFFLVGLCIALWCIAH